MFFETANKIGLITCVDGEYKYFVFLKLLLLFPFTFKILIKRYVNIITFNLYEDLAFTFIFDI